MRIANKHRLLADKASKKLNRLILPSEITPLYKAAVTLHKLLECECNGASREKFSGESWEAYDKARLEVQIPWIEKRLSTITKRIGDMCKALNLPFYIQSDPRGGTLYIGTSSNTNYNSEGFLVY